MNEPERGFGSPNIQDPQEGEVPVTGEAKGWAKNSDPFIQRGTYLEARLANLTDWITPNHLFFVRNNSPESPRIDSAAYHLRVAGDAIRQPLELSYAEIRAMPSHALPAYIECAGNQRSLFREVMGKEADGGEWLTGGVGNAVWTGVPLAYILRLAGIRDNAVQVNIQGLDVLAPEGGFQRPMSVEKAMDQDTILAYEMNGETLPVDHGFPIRAVVPGWVGASSIKWAGTITVSSQNIWVRNNTTSYVMVGEEWSPELYAPAQGAPITEQNIKSALALPWPASLSPGRQRLHGFAFSPQAAIERVEWSENGQDWQAAKIVSPNLRYAWVRFEFEWDAPAGHQGLWTRATDAKGNTQPAELPFNEKGYLFNRIYRYPVSVIR